MDVDLDTPINTTTDAVYTDSAGRVIPTYVRGDRCFVDSNVLNRMVTTRRRTGDSTRGTNKRGTGRTKRGTAKDRKRAPRGKPRARAKRRRRSRR